jgi:hypothetical protein
LQSDPVLSLATKALFQTPHCAALGKAIFLSSGNLPRTTAMRKRAW